MHAVFYFDPSCPWSWVTSRWLNEVAENREISLTFKPFSLALKNDELSGKNVTEHTTSHLASHRVLRLIEAVGQSQHHDMTAQLYTKFGHAIHNQNIAVNDELSHQILTDCQLDATLLNAMTDPSYDEQLQTYIDEATTITGKDVGVPLLVLSDGVQTRGFFGPVLGSLPQPDAGLRLWDGLASLFSVTDFYELKSNRTHPVELDSTSRLFPD